METRWPDTLVLISLPMPKSESTFQNRDQLCSEITIGLVMIHLAFLISGFCSRWIQYSNNHPPWAFVEKLGGPPFFSARRPQYPCGFIPTGIEYVGRPRLSSGGTLDEINWRCIGIVVK